MKRTLTGILLILVAPFAAHADWINLTGAETAPTVAEIYIAEDHIKLDIEIYPSDLKYFEDLLPDEAFNEPPKNRPPLKARLKRFSQETFRFIPKLQRPLDVELISIEPTMRKDRASAFTGMRNIYTGQLINQPPEDPRVIRAVLKFPFRSTRPETLQIIPPLDKDGNAELTIGFIAYHKSVPIIDFRYLGAPANLFLDWADPWYTSFENKNLTRHHKYALMPFIYVEPFEVRQEVLVRVKDLEEWMELGLRGKEFIELDEMEALLNKIAKFLMSKNPLMIDGKLGVPILDRASFVKIGQQGLQVLPKPTERIDLSIAIVGVIFSYLTDGIPKEVTLDWQLFNEEITQIPTMTVDPAGPFKGFASTDDSLIVWKNFLKKYKIPTVEELIIVGAGDGITLPAASLIWMLLVLLALIKVQKRQELKQRGSVFASLILAAAVGGFSLKDQLRIRVGSSSTVVANFSEADAKTVLQSLLKNVYRAFDYKSEEAIYDKLALSVRGDLLSEIYLQNRKSLAVQKAGGAQAKVKEVELLDVDIKPLDRDLAYQCESTWTAMGSVGHWGHTHMRKNRYKANVTIEPIEERWKITGLEILEEERVDPFDKSKS